MLVDIISIVHSLRSLTTGIFTFQIAGICNTIFAAIYPATFSLYSNTLCMALLCQACCFLKIFGLIVM